MKCQIWCRTVAMMMRMKSMVEVMKSGVLMMMLPVTKVGKVKMTMNLQLSMSPRWRRCQCKKGLVIVTGRDEVCPPARFIEMYLATTADDEARHNPETVREALDSSHREKWQAAMGCMRLLTGHRGRRSSNPSGC